MGRPGLTQAQQNALNDAYISPGTAGNASACARKVGVSKDQAARHFKKLLANPSGYGPTRARLLEQLESELERMKRDSSRAIDQAIRQVRQLRTDIEERRP